ncbi:MAG: hypothetical protein F7C33_04290 [Desulfurococcales archaeon]|nr:hypothetical protein [Desulfurococcales archaeon]
MLTPKTLALPAYPPSKPEEAQAQVEELVALHLEGKIQAGLVASSWSGEGLVLGFYEAYREGARWRRITGGPSYKATGATGYAGLVFASEDLGEVAEIASRLAECIGGEAWGVTRIGPPQLAAGVVEVLGGFTPDTAVACVQEELFGVRLEAKSVGLKSTERISKAYAAKGWVHYTGAVEMPFVGRVERGDYWVRMGIAVTGDGFISNARIDGVFHAAPPNEPYNLVNAVLGMPAGEQALDLFEARSNLVEVWGLERSDLVEALARAIDASSKGLDDE